MWKCVVRPINNQKSDRVKICLCLLSRRIHFGKRTPKHYIKNELEVGLSERFLKAKDEDREMDNVQAFEVSEYTSRFIISVRNSNRLPLEV